MYKVQAVIHSSLIYFSAQQRSNLFPTPRVGTLFANLDWL